MDITPPSLLWPESHTATVFLFMFDSTLEKNRKKRTHAYTDIDRIEQTNELRLCSCKAFGADKNKIRVNYNCVHALSFSRNTMSVMEKLEVCALLLLCFRVLASPCTFFTVTH